MSKGKRKKARKQSVPNPAPKPTAPLSEPPRKLESDPVPEPAGAVSFEVETGPFFRRPDWIAFAAVTLVTLAVYLFTLAPNVTLEDSGELATASMYAGVPHAPGYPFWTIYSWTFTKLLPFGNIAWRVGVSSAVAAALACGLTGLMISRGSRLFFGSIEELRELNESTQGAISFAAGFAGGTIFGLTGFMWSQAIIVEVYTLSTFTFAAVLALLMRWYFIPDRHWSLYAAYLVFGLCLANHQTLLLAAVGIELMIFMRHREIGRDLFICNSIIYLAGLLYFSDQGGGSTTSGKLLLFGTFNLVGVGCLLLAIWHSLSRPDGAPRSAPLLLGSAYLLVFLLLSIFWINFIWPIAAGVTQAANEVMPGSVSVWNLSAVWRYGMTNMSRMILLFCFFLSIAAILSLVWLAILADKKSKRSIYSGICLALFLAFGFVWMWFMLQSRGQVLVGGPPEITKVVRDQLDAYFAKANQMTFFFVLSSLAGLTAVLLHNWATTKTKAFAHWRPLLVTRVAALAGLLFYFFMPLSSLTNPPMNWAYPRTAEGFEHAIKRGQYTGPSKESTESVNRFLLDIDGNGRLDGGQIGVFISETLQEFNPAYTLLALLPLAMWWRMAERERRWLGGLFIIFVSLTTLMIAFRNPGGSEQQRHLNKVFFESSHLFVALGLGWGLALATGFMASQWKTYREPLLIGASILLGLELLWWPITQTAISATPASLIFALASYEAPILIAAAVIGVLLTGGVCGLLLFRRKAAPMGLLLAIICLLPVRHGLANWWDNELRGHYFGYWYGRDMFATNVKDENGDLIYPPMAKDAILFGGTDAGRFCPTYMIFCESLTDPKFRTDKDFDRRDAYIITQNALADRTYLQYIRAHYNRSQQIDPPPIGSFLASRGTKSINKIYQKEYNKLELSRNSHMNRMNEALLQLNKVLRQSQDGTNIQTENLTAIITQTLQSLPPGDPRDLQIRQLIDQVRQYSSITNASFIDLQKIAKKRDKELAELLLFAPASRAGQLANQLDSPLSDWGDRVEGQYRTLGTWFEPAAINVPKLAAHLQHDSPVSRFVLESLNPVTRKLLATPDASRLPSKLAGDLNELIYREEQRNRRHTKQLREMEFHESTLLLPARYEFSDDDLIEMARHVDDRRRGLATLLSYCQLSGNEPDTLSEKLSKTDNALLGLYGKYGTQLGETYDRLRNIMKDRAEIVTEMNSALMYSTESFYNVKLSKHTKALLKQAPQTHARVYLNRRLLEDAFPNALQRAPGGVYPALEIYIPDENDYSISLNRVRNMAGLKEEQMVWAVNSDLTKIIFDKNPGHEFYLEESMPLPWMFPHLVPYGIILKIERTPSYEWDFDRQQEICARDRAFWNKYIERLIGWNVAGDPHTSLPDICDWINRVYLRRNHSGHTSVQRRFLRSYVAQRAFSKLRLNIAKLYYWRAKKIDELKTSLPKDPKEAAERILQLNKRQKLLLTEADFAFRQAYAFCPVSAETVHEYLIFLLSNGKTAESQSILNTSLHLDDSDDVLSKACKQQLLLQARTHYTLGSLTNARAIVKIGRENFSRFTASDPGLTDRVVFDRLLSSGKYRESFKHISRGIPAKTMNQKINWNSLIAYAGVLSGHLEAKPNDQMLQALSAQVFRLLPAIAAIQLQNGVIPRKTYAQLRGRFLVAESKLRRQLTEQTPDRPDAWYELGITLNHLRKTNEALDCLRKAWEFSGKTNTPRSIVDIRELIRTTNSLNNLREMPEFKTIIQKP